MHRNRTIPSLVLALFLLLTACGRQAAPTPAITGPGSLSGSWGGMINEYSGVQRTIELVLVQTEGASELTGTIHIVSADGTMVEDYAVSGTFDGSAVRFATAEGLNFWATVSGDTMTGEAAVGCYDCSEVAFGQFNLTYGDGSGADLGHADQTGGESSTPVLGVSLADLGERGAVVSQINDVDTRGSGPAGFATGGDDPQAGRFERPFNPMMGYLNPIDILSASLSTGNPYHYFDIQTAGNNPYSGAMDARYAVELDTDLDGRGNYLIWIVPPYTTVWSTAPVMIFQDTNADVGGPTPLYADPGGAGDGYDTSLFDGISTNSEPVALARLNPDDPSLVQVAMDPAFFNNPPYYLWWVWADGGTACPQCLDYNDFLDMSTAGSPLQEAANYPIISPYALDNTCRAAYGFDPTGMELALCTGGAVSQATGTSADTQPGGGQPGSDQGGSGPGGGAPSGGNDSGDENMPASARVTGYTYLDTNRNGIWDAGESATSSYPVGLYGPDCSTLQYSGSTASDGKFIFDGIIGGGDFCVHPDTADLTWSPSYANLSLGQGGYAVVNFGLQSGTGGGQGDTGGGETGGGGVPPAQGRIHGLVVFDADGNGAEATDAPATSYAVLLLESTCRTGLAIMSPRSDGSYAFEGLPPGTYCVALLPFDLPAQAVTVPAGGSMTADFALPTSAPPPPPPPPPPAVTGSIHGTTFVDVDGSGSMDPGEVGRSVTVILYDAGSGSCGASLATTTSSSSGSFTFGGLQTEHSYCLNIEPSFLSTGMSSPGQLFISSPDMLWNVPVVNSLY